jgi:hypothetical protein
MIWPTSRRLAGLGMVVIATLVMTWFMGNKQTDKQLVPATEAPVTRDLPDSRLVDLMPRAADLGLRCRVLGLHPDAELEWTVVDGSVRRQQGKLPRNRIIQSNLEFPAYIQLQIEGQPAWGCVVDGELEQEAQLHIPPTGELELIFDPAIKRTNDSQASILDPSEVANRDSSIARSLLRGAARGSLSRLVDLELVLRQTLEREEGTWGMEPHATRIPEAGVVLWKQVPANTPLRWASRDLTGVVIQPIHETWEDARNAGYGVGHASVRRNLSGLFEVAPQGRTRFVMGDELSGRLRVVLPPNAISGILDVMDRGHSTLPEGGPLETIAQLLKVHQRGEGFLVSGLEPGEYRLWARWRMEDGCFAFSRAQATFPGKGERVVHMRTDNTERVSVEVPFVSHGGNVLGMLNSCSAEIFISEADRKRPMYQVMFPVDLSKPVYIEGLPSGRNLKIRIQPSEAIRFPDGWTMIGPPPSLITSVSEGPLWSVPCELVPDEPIVIRLATSTGEPFSSGTVESRSATSDPLGLHFDVQADGTALVKFLGLQQPVLLKVWANTEAGTPHSGLHLIDPSRTQRSVIKVPPATTIKGWIAKDEKTGQVPPLIFYPPQYRERLGNSIENLFPVIPGKGAAFLQTWFPANTTLGVRGSSLVITTLGPGEVLDLGLIQID